MLREQLLPASSPIYYIIVEKKRYFYMKTDLGYESSEKE